MLELKDQGREYFEIIQGIPKTDQNNYKELFNSLCDLSLEKHRRGNKKLKDKLCEVDPRFNAFLKDRLKTIAEGREWSIESKEISFLFFDKAVSPPS